MLDYFLEMQSHVGTLKGQPIFSPMVKSYKFPFSISRYLPAGSTWVITLGLYPAPLWILKENVGRRCLKYELFISQSYAYSIFTVVRQTLAFSPSKETPPRCFGFGHTQRCLFLALHSRITPEVWGDHVGLWGIKPDLAVCKASTLPTVLSLCIPLPSPSVFCLLVNSLNDCSIWAFGKVTVWVKDRATLTSAQDFVLCDHA